MKKTECEQMNAQLHAKAENTPRLHWYASPQTSGTRLDAFVSNMLPNISRSRIQRIIANNKIFVEGIATKASFRLRGHEHIWCTDDLKPLPIEDKPEPIEIDISFENDDYMVVDKPAGMVVHPGAGNRNHTLVNALLYWYPNLQSLPRAGLIHRLDKDTSGLLVVAKHHQSYTQLVELLSKRLISRLYLAVCWGNLHAAQHVTLPIGRSRHNRCKFVVREDGKTASTQITPLQHFTHTTLVEIALFTGRTHQIRVHMHHLGYPLVGDKLYFHRSNDNTFFHRQALHAAKLCIPLLTGHASSNATASTEVAIQSPLPADMQQLLTDLYRERCPTTTGGS